MKFYTFPQSQFTVNLDEVLVFGKFRTYADREKTQPIEKYMVKMKLASKGGHPYTQEITEQECHDFEKFCGGEHVETFEELDSADIYQNEKLVGTLSVDQTWEQKSDQEQCTIKKVLSNDKSQKVIVRMEESGDFKECEAVRFISTHFFISKDGE